MPTSGRYDSLSGFNEAFRRFMGEAPTSLTDAKVVTLTRIPTPLGPMVLGLSMTPSAFSSLPTDA
jgi:AraC-like DNA-binding protein